LNVQRNQYFKNEQFKNNSRIFKDAAKYSRATTCFSRIKDITSFDQGRLATLTQGRLATLTTADKACQHLKAQLVTTKSVFKFKMVEDNF